GFFVAVKFLAVNFFLPKNYDDKSRCLSTAFNFKKKAFEKLAAPVGRIHFAGEATSASSNGTLHGAYLSGLRAAQQIANL
ncbi:MAG: FAD-dependent oxidoreductase, partial [Bacteroidota bacterium]